MPKKNAKKVAQDANPQPKIDLNEFKKRLQQAREERKKNAIDLYLPSVDMTIKVAPASASDYYFEVLNIFRSLPAEETENRPVIPVKTEEGRVLGIDRNQARVLLKASIVEPELDDEAVELLFNLPIGEFQMLIMACIAASASSIIELSEKLGNVETGGLEGFFGTTPSGSKELTQQ